MLVLQLSNWGLILIVMLLIEFAAPVLMVSADFGHFALAEQLMVKFVMVLLVL